MVILEEMKQLLKELKIEIDLKVKSAWKTQSGVDTMQTESQELLTTNSTKGLQKTQELTETGNIIVQEVPVPIHLVEWFRTSTESVDQAAEAAKEYLTCHQHLNIQKTDTLKESESSLGYYNK